MNNIYHPDHYNQGILPGECIDYVKYLDFCRGNVIKYLWRYEGKNGAEDMEKAAQYCDFLAQYPEVVSGKIPEELGAHLSNNCYDIILDDDLKGTPKYDFIMCIHTLAHMEPGDKTKNTVLIAQMFSKVIRKHAESKLNT